MSKKRIVLRSFQELKQLLAAEDLKKVAEEIKPADKLDEASLSEIDKAKAEKIRLAKIRTSAALKAIKVEEMAKKKAVTRLGNGKIKPAKTPKSNKKRNKDKKDWDKGFD